MGHAPSKSTRFKNFAPLKDASSLNVAPLNSTRLENVMSPKEANPWNVVNENMILRSNNSLSNLNDAGNVKPVKSR